MKQSSLGFYSHMGKGYSRTSVSVWLLLIAGLLLGMLFMLGTSKTSSALTTVPTKMNFQGRLTDASGNIKPNGTYNMRLKLYTVSSGGSAVWSEDRLVSATQGVQVTNGLFSLKLGDITSLPASLFASGELYLEVELPTPATATSASPVWTEGPMTPRNQMATSAYAYNAETLDGLDSAEFGQTAANNAWTGTNTYSVLSQNALVVQNGSSAEVFKVDTVNQKVTVGVHESSARLGIEGMGGSVWTARNAAEANDWNGITYGNGLYVAVSTTGTNQIMTSPDGITWTARAAPINGSIAITYGNGLFVAVSYISNQVMTSSDGITWTARTVPELNRWWSVTYGNGLFVAVSEDGNNRVMTSPDGITWTARAAAEANQWQSVTYGNGLFVAVSATGTNRVMTSPDGITWTARSTGAVDGVWRSVTYGGGIYVAIANGGTNEIMTSPDGITWTARITPLNGGWNNWYEVTYGNGQFLAVANGGEDQVMTSPDGITWTAHAAAQANSWQAVTYGNEQFVAVSYDGTNRVMTSKDVALSTRGKVEVVGNVSASGSLSVSGGATIGGVFSIDTTNSSVRIGPATADANAVVLILDSKNTAGDPVGVNGASYYNSNSGKFRCYENGAWKDCDTGGITSGITAQRPASPTEGTQFFDTTVKQLLVYANGKWQGDRSGATKIVGMGAAAGCTGSVPVASQNYDSADYVVTSCTSAQTTINSAITALPAGGGTVYLMEGTYIIDGNILPNNNVTIAGAGKSTIIKFKDSTPTSTFGIYAISKNRLVIRDLKIDGNKANNAGLAHDGIYMGSVGSGSGATAIPGVSIDSVEVLNMARYGIYTNGAVNSSVSNTSVIASANRGIHMSTMTNNVISNGTVQGNGSDGIYVGGGTGGNIAGNVLEGNTGNGISIGSGTRIAITGNSIKSNTDTGIQAASSGSSITGNTIASNGTRGIYLAGSEYVVSGNTIVSNTSDGIYFQTSSDNNISGNSIVSNGGNGIYAWNSNNRNSITSNTFRDNGGTGSSHGIYLNLSSNYNIIADNHITDTAGTGVAINIPGSVDYTTLSNNTYSGTGAASITDSSATTIYSNQIDANGTLINRGRSAFSVNTTSSTSSFSLQGGMTNTQLPAPAQPTVARVGTEGTTTYGYRVSALDGTGETLASTERTITTANATLTGANYNTVTWIGVPGAVQYKIYRTTAGGTPSSTGLIGTVSGGVITFSDTGLAASTAVPAANTTGGLSIAGALQGTSAALTGKLVANGGFDFVDSAPFARFSSGRIALGSNGNTYAGMDFTIREDTAITSETNGYTFTRSGSTNLGANITTQRLNVFNAPSYSGAFTLTNAATVAIGGAATAVGGAVITNNYSLWVQGGTVRMDAGTGDAVGQIIRGASGQSADLLQAQNDAGTVIAKIDASGQIQTPKINFVDAGGGLSGLSYDTNNNVRFGVLNFGGGQGNVSIGQSADQTRGSGDGNVAIGRYAANGSGSYNVALGNGSGNNSTGGYNTSIGDSSGASITSGASNTFLGARAGNNDNDGTDVWRSLASAQNSTAIGSGAQVQSSNSLVLGSVYNNTKVGIGITAPTNILSVSPLVLHNSWATGFVEASQAGNTVTASSSQFSASNVGEILMWSDGTQTTITGYTSGTVVTVASSETRAASYFRTHKVGFQVASSGFVGIGILNPSANLDVKTNLNTTTAFRIQDASGTSLMTADTVNMKVTVKSLEVESNITVNGHIISGGSTPTVTIPTDCFDLSPNSTVSITGTDTAGKITLNVASGEWCEDPGANGSIIQVNFSSAYSSAPYVSLTRGMYFDNELKEGVNATTGGFTITAPTGSRYATPVVPLGAATYTWYYHVIQ